LAVAGFAQIAMSVVGIAASCEDKGVVAEVINQITCENLVICSSIQLPNYESIGRMNPEQIATWYAGTTIGQNEDSIRKTDIERGTPPAFEDRLLAYIKRAHTEYAYSLQNLITNARGVSDDYNPTIKRYFCTLEFEFNKVQLTRLYKTVLLSQLIGDQLTLSVAAAEAKKTPPKDYLGFMYELGIQKFSLDSRFAALGRQTAQFTVQQSAAGETIVRLQHYEAPKFEEPQ